ncbi:hypothetical protein HDV00_012523 [Rhizophlyctis rosea]|nr:hypothetical protein HDV00_012523 [Rhizophlyctis rosea]
MEKKQQQDVVRSRGDPASAPTISVLYPVLEPDYSIPSTSTSSSATSHLPPSHAAEAVTETAPAGRTSTVSSSSGTSSGGLADWFGWMRRGQGQSEERVDVPGADVLERELRRLLEEVKGAVVRRPELAERVNGVVDQTAINLRYTIDLALSQINAIVHSPDAQSGSSGAVHPDLPPPYVPSTEHATTASTSQQQLTTPATTTNATPRPLMKLSEAITHVLGVGPVLRPASPAVGTTPTPPTTSSAQKATPAPPSAPSQSNLPVAESTTAPPQPLSPRPGLRHALSATIGVNPRETVDRLSYMFGGMLAAIDGMRPQRGEGSGEGSGVKGGVGAREKAEGGKGGEKA